VQYSVQKYLQKNCTVQNVVQLFVQIDFLKNGTDAENGAKNLRNAVQFFVQSFVQNLMQNFVQMLMQYAVQILLQFLRAERSCKVEMC